MTFKIKIKTTLPQIMLGRMNAYIDKTKKTIWMIMLEEFQRAVVLAYIHCPVKSGHMQSQVKIAEMAPNELRIRGGVYTYYAPFIEFGTVRMRARPFWRPPMWEAFFRMRERIKRIEGEM